MTKQFAQVKIFLAYASEDESKTRELYNKLADSGFRPWMDKVDIVPGQDWKYILKKAIISSVRQKQLFSIIRILSILNW